jgi:hypothetical protein
MEGPKKLYICDYGGYNWHPERSAVKDIEYIRKDAFIEKAEKWLKENVLEYVPEMNFGVWKTDPDYYTKHFIEDFKNYLKG